MDLAINGPCPPLHACLQVANVIFCQKRLRLRMTKAQLYDVWKQLDLNGSGVINFSEFAAILFPNASYDELEAAMAPNLTQATRGDDSANVRPPAQQQPAIGARPH